MHAQQSSWPIVFSFHTSWLHSQISDPSATLKSFKAGRFGLTIFKCLFFNLLVHLMNWSLLKVLIPVFWPQMKQPRPMVSLRQKIREFGHPCSLKFESLHLFALLSRRMRSLRTVFNDVQRVAHILSSVPAKCWFWLFLHFIVLWIPVVLEYNVFVCRCNLYFAWTCGCRLRCWWRSFSISWAIYCWSERPWFSGQGGVQHSSLKATRNKVQTLFTRENMLNFAFKLATRRSIAAAGGSRPVQGQKSSKHNETQTNVATLTKPPFLEVPC